MFENDTYCGRNYHRGFVVFCLSVDTFCQHNSMSTVQDTASKLYRCVVEIKIKAEFKDVLCYHTSRDAKSAAFAIPLTECLQTEISQNTTNLFCGSSCYSTCELLQ